MTMMKQNKNKDITNDSQKRSETLNNNSLNVSEKAEATKKVHVSGEMVVFVAKKSIL